MQAILRLIRYVSRFTLHIILFLALAVSTGLGDEKVRIAGMGGVKIGMNPPEAGLFGNPAALSEVELSNLSMASSAENYRLNYRFEELSQTSAIQLGTEVTLDSQPSIYYSGSFGDWGVALGYTATLEILAAFQIEATRSGDITDQQNFSGEAEMIIGYNLFWESGVAIGVSREVGAGTVGIRLREVSQTARYGRIVSGLHLEPQSLPDVNFNDPGELISTIVDGIDFSSLDQYIIGEGGKSIQDLAMSTFEIDLGYQRNFSITEAQQLRAGLIVENLLQRKLIRPLPRKLGIGVGYKPIDWIGIGFDIWRVAGYPGFDFALGGELQSPWKHSLLGAALRGGLGRIDTVGTFSVGWSLVIGHLYCEYTLQKRFRDQLLDQATHIFASTIRF